MTRSAPAIFIFLITACTSAGISQAADLAVELKACATIADRDARLSCFDRLSDGVVHESPAAGIPEPGSAPLPPNDPVDSTQRNEPAPTSAQYGGLVTSCKKSYYGNWLFFFENGQVWKEANNRNMRFKDCNFNAAITKDRFGYKMQIEGDDKNIRVKRNR